MADRRRDRSRSRSRSPRRRNRDRDREKSKERDHRDGRDNHDRSERDRPPRPAREQSPPFTVDREKTCPLLLRVFYNYGRHHRTDEFSRGHTPAAELQIYTWKDATLKELMTLVKEVNPDAQRRGTVFSFAIVMPNNRRPGFRLKEIGLTEHGRKSPADSLTLEKLSFRIGDYIDVAIMRESRPFRGSWSGDQTW